MLNILRSRLSLFIPALLTATQVQAHSGEHSETTLMQALNHIFSSPYHTALFVGAGFIVAVVFHKVNRLNDSK